MTNIHVRNLDNNIAIQLRHMAHAEGMKSLEPYIRQVLVNHVTSNRLKAQQEISALRKKIWKGNVLPDGTGATYIREDRDA